MQQETLIFANLCRVIKQRRIYHLFRQALFGCCHKHYLGFAYTHYGIDGISYGEGMPLSDVMNLQQLVGVIKKHITPHGTDEKHKQMYVADEINILIHTLIEPMVQDKRVCGEIGQEVFDKTCKQIFGKDFKDLTGDGMPAEMPSDLRERAHRGEIRPEEIERFLQYIRQHREHRQQQDMRNPYTEQPRFAIDDDDFLIDEFPF